MPISLQTAGAGSGKTYSITGQIADAIGDPDRAVSPEGVIATTFTNTAASELRERIRGRLLGEAAKAEDPDRRNRLTDAAGRLDLAAIGTVHSLCRSLLERFALEAGLSPEVRVIEERESKRLLATALDDALSFAEQEKLTALGRKLGQTAYEEGLGQQLNWRKQIESLISLTRCNDLDPDDLPAMGEANWKVLREHLDDSTGDPDALERELHTLLTSVTADYEHAATDYYRAKGTEIKKAAADCLQRLKERLGSSGRGTLTWPDWVSLTPSNQGPKAVTGNVRVLDELVGHGRKATSHPQLHEDLKSYVTTLFTNAGEALATYIELKGMRGCVDFADLENRTLQLLRDNEHVRETLRAETRLLVVDEFQDTNPIQLAIFLELTKCAKETLWVGDLKQAIYGFRDTDPALIAAIADQPTIARLDPLDTSYRSSPDIVRFTNAVFTPAFRKSLGLEADEVELKSNAAATPEPDPVHPSLGFLQLNSRDPSDPRSRASDKRADPALADAILEFLEDDPPPVFDKESEEWRPMRPGDIAILARTKARTTGLAASFLERGVAVSFAKPGLLDTPEAALALACLRRLADPGDDLAAAQIIALAGSRDPEDWLPKRIAWLKTARNGGNPSWGHKGYTKASAILCALDEASSSRKLEALSPAGALELALGVGDVTAIAAAWGPDASRGSARRDNLEQLRALGTAFESEWSSAGHPATLGGLVGWLDDLADKKLDDLAAEPNPGAINILTYHGSKGLEWPVVFAYQLNWEPKSRIWDPRAVRENPALPLDPEDPLAKRTLRLLINPFGSKSSRDPLAESLAETEEWAAAERDGLHEEQRLLYVGLTRARNRLFLVRDGTNTPFLANGDPEGITGPGWDGSELLAHAETPITILHREKAYIPHAPEAPVPTPMLAFPRRQPIRLDTDLPATIKPSGTVDEDEQALSTEDARIGKIIELGSRILINGGSSGARSRDLGDAIHVIFAAGILRPGSVTETQAAAILDRFDLSGIVTPADVLSSLQAYLKALDSHFGVSISLQTSKVEVPFSYRNPQGQRLTGYIDHLLETPDGSIIIDHKTSRADDDDARAEKALSYSGQLRAYRDALPPEQRDNLKTWIHFPLTGHLVEVRN